MTLHAVTEYRHFKAPQSPNTSFVDPSLSELDSWASRVWEADRAADIEFCGQSWTKVRQLARKEAVGLAAEYTSQYADVSLASLADASSSALVLSGHQPELFHAGVWFKNVLLSRFAEQQGAVAINFLVDNDLCRDPSIRVPSCESSGKLVAANVAFDSYRTPVPWELRSLESWDVWHEFPKQVERHLGPLIDYRPLIQQLCHWPHRLCLRERKSAHRWHKPDTDWRWPLGSERSKSHLACWSARQPLPASAFSSCPNCQDFKRFITRNARPIDRLIAFAMQPTPCRSWNNPMVGLKVLGGSTAVSLRSAIGCGFAC